MLIATLDGLLRHFNEKARLSWHRGPDGIHMAVNTLRRGKMGTQGLI